MPAPQGELHVVDKSPANWTYIVMHVFEHLVEASKDGTLVPGLATSWRWLDDRTLEMTLRQGVTLARHLLGEAGFAEGLPLSLIASEELQVQATVVSKMLEQAGFRVDLQLLDGAAFNRKVKLDSLDQPPEHQPWDIALMVHRDAMNFPVFQVYHAFALGPSNWGIADEKLRQLHDAVLRTVDREQQQALIRQMERHTHDQAYFLFLYNPIQLYAANKAVAFTPYVTILNLAETGVTDQHWSVRKQKASTPE
jgi:peptide/nickel transport system substrate-binding protein